MSTKRSQLSMASKIFGDFKPYVETASIISRSGVRKKLEINPKSKLARVRVLFSNGSERLIAIEDDKAVLGHSDRLENMALDRPATVMA